LFVLILKSCAKIFAKSPLENKIKKLMENTAELSPSHLGTKDYWDESYTTEIKNYISHGDVGDVWFDESSQFRVIKWMNHSADISTSDSIIDLGERALVGMLV
jgi:hypothetical protein